MSDLTAALGYFRDRQAEQFTATATVVRPTGEPTFNSATGAVTQATTTVYTDLECKLTSNDRAGQDIQAGENELRQVDSDIKFPVESDIRKDDVVTITSSTHNPTDVGRVYRVTDVDDREWQISRRCVVEETLVPDLNE